MHGYKKEQVHTKLCYMKAIQCRVPFSQCYQIKSSDFMRCNTHKLFTSRLDYRWNNQVWAEISLASITKKLRYVGIYKIRNNYVQINRACRNFPPTTALHPFPQPFHVTKPLKQTFLYLCNPKALNRVPSLPFDMTPQLKVRSHLHNAHISIRVMFYYLAPY